MPTTIIDPALYYNQDYIRALVASGKKDVAIVVTSWSGSALKFPRSINIGARQIRDLPHHLVFAQKLKAKGINLKIYYLAFDNTQHFNQKDKRSVDNTVSKAYRDYILSFEGIALEDDQFEGFYLNPRYREKDGDLVDKDLPVISTLKGESLHFTGENAILLRELKEKLNRHKLAGHLVLGLTAHSGGDELDGVANYLRIPVIGASEASCKYGTKEGNKKLFELANVPYVVGSTKAQKDFGALLDDGYKVAEKTHAKVLIIKHNSSSAGKGNLDVNISKCYNPDGSPQFDNIRRTMWDAIQKYTHSEKDKDILPGVENFYMRKIRELGAIVEAKLEGKNIVSPASFGVVRMDGSVEVEYIYDQVLSGASGQNFGGSIGPSELSEADVRQMAELTRKIGDTLSRQGGRGYFGVDFLKVDNQDVIVIEANLRKTGTKYPYIMAKHLLGDELLRKKTIFHDDNLKVPVSLSDITGRRDELNLFMDEFLYWILHQDVTFNKTTWSGAILTFETHTAGKIGVLSIGNSREHVRAIRKRFEDLFKHFSLVIYPSLIVSKHPAGVDLSKSTVPGVPRTVDVRALPKRHQVGLVSGPIVGHQSRDCLGVISTRADLFLDRTQHALSKTAEKVSHGKLFATRHRHCASATLPLSVGPYAEFQERIRYAQQHPFIPHDQLMEQRVKVRDLVFAILGRTKSSDSLLIEAAKRNIVSYRMTENSVFSFNENTRDGSVRNLSFPKIDKRTGKWKIVSDETTEFQLPTVVYDYDFSASRKLVYQSRGDRLYLDKITTVKDFIEKIGAVFYNGDPMEIDSAVSRISVLRSQWALSLALRDHDPNLYQLYPKTFSLVDTRENHIKLLNFIESENSFYLKPVLAERRPEIYLGNIFVKKIIERTGERSLSFEYRVKEFKGERSTLIPRNCILPLSRLKIAQLLSLIDRIKGEMSFSPEVQFFVQSALQTPEIKDQSGRALSSKIRVITQRNPRLNEIGVTSLYGLYGGPNAFLSYVGDPKILIIAYLKMIGAMGCESEASVYDKIFATAKRTHQAVEACVRGRMGELVTDVLLSTQGVVPLKINSKPERPDLEVVAQQTHFGVLLEGSKDARNKFIDALGKNEEIRYQTILDEILKIHREEFYPAELHRKTKIDRTVQFVSGEPLPPGVPIPILRAGPFI